MMLTAAAIVVGGVGLMWAQGKTEEAGGSLAALTAEVRQLRIAVEDSARQQTQTQALSVSLSAQQSRMVQIGARLDAVRNDLGGATMRARETARLVTAAQQELTQAPDARERTEAADMVQMFRQQANQAAAQEQSLRARETELIQALQSEEARWADLIVRLEQLIKK
jgi:hypothetical protein